jgi:hypothetical protein
VAFAFSLMPLGGLLLGALAERLGAAPAVWVGSGIYLLVIAWVALGQPVIRQLDGRTLSAADPGDQPTAADPVQAR